VSFLPGLNAVCSPAIPVTSTPRPKALAALLRLDGDSAFSWVPGDKWKAHEIGPADWPIIDRLGREGHLVYENNNVRRLRQSERHQRPPL
jgi:hypothetical protein